LKFSKTFSMKLSSQPAASRLTWMLPLLGSAFLPDDLRGDLFVAAHRIDGDQRPFQVQQLQQYRR
jgi:hypothetical protein